MKFSLMMRTAFLMLPMSALLSLSISAHAGSIVLDGDFLSSIGTGGNLTPWSDFTNAGVTRHSAPGGIQGNYASLPVGTDLYQQFSALPNGGYVVSFLVQNKSSNPAQLVFAVQQGGGTPIGTLFAAGTAEELSLPASSQFMSETLTFFIHNSSFTPDEFYFSNSFDAPISPIQNSINPAGTIINVADVTLCSFSSYPCSLAPSNFADSPITSVPEASTWAMMLVGFSTLGLSGYRRMRKRTLALAIPT